jgi:hypothetical protein
VQIEDKRFNLESMKVSSPCPVQWENMSGDSKKRFCSDCKLNVYNISQMTRAEAEELLGTKRKGNRLCVKFYRSTDGTVITKDCAVEKRNLRRRNHNYLSGLVAALMLVLPFVSACVTKPAEVQSEDIYNSEGIMGDVCPEENIATPAHEAAKSRSNQKPIKKK